MNVCERCGSPTTNRKLCANCKQVRRGETIMDLPDSAFVDAEEREEADDGD